MRERAAPGKAFGASARMRGQVARTRGRVPAQRPEAGAGCRWGGSPSPWPTGPGSDVSVHALPYPVQAAGCRRKHIVPVHALPYPPLRGTGRAGAAAERTVQKTCSHAPQGGRASNFYTTCRDGRKKLSNFCTARRRGRAPGQRVFYNILIKKNKIILARSLLYQEQQRHRPGQARRPATATGTAPTRYTVPYRLLPYREVRHATEPFFHRPPRRRSRMAFLLLRPATGRGAADSLTDLPFPQTFFLRPAYPPAGGTESGYTDLPPSSS